MNGCLIIQQIVENEGQGFVMINLVLCLIGTLLAYACRIGPLSPTSKCHSNELMYTNTFKVSTSVSVIQKKCIVVLRAYCLI
jgi:hypothetical protein